MFNYIKNIKKKNILIKTPSSILYKKNNYIIKKTNIKQFNKNQYNILQNINHPNIIKIISNYQDNNYNYDIIRYYKNGDLYNNLENNISNLNYRIKNENILKKLINPIYYIHKNNIVHLDLKLENFLVDDNLNLILTDFDISKYHINSYYYLQNIQYSVGTKHYMAPELLEGYFCKSSDIYSLGCIIYLLYTKTFFKNEINYNKLQNVPNKIVDMITSSLKTNPKERPNIFDCKYYYFI